MHPEFAFFASHKIELLIKQLRQKTLCAAYAALLSISKPFFLRKIHAPKWIGRSAFGQSPVYRRRNKLHILRVWRKCTIYVTINFIYLSEILSTPNANGGERVRKCSLRQTINEWFRRCGSFGIYIYIYVVYGLYLRLYAIRIMIRPLFAQSPATNMAIFTSFIPLLATIVCTDCFRIMAMYGVLSHVIWLPTAIQLFATVHFFSRFFACTIFRFFFVFLLFRALLPFICHCICRFFGHIPQMIWSRRYMYHEFPEFFFVLRSFRMQLNLYWPEELPFLQWQKQQVFFYPFRNFIFGFDFDIAALNFYVTCHVMNPK